MVLVFHVLASWRTPTTGAAFGTAGVTMFFTLSGFLITCILLEQRSAGLGRFYRNRALRLLPALVAMVAVVTPFQMALGIGTPGMALAPLVYMTNWVLVAGGRVFLLDHTWTLAVEEHFYLVWPVLLLVSRRWRDGPLMVICLGIAVSFGARLLLWVQGADPGRYAGTDIAIGPLFVGCLLAVLAHRGLRPVRLPWAPAAGVALVVATGVVFGGGELAQLLLVPVLVPWLTAVMIWSLCSTPSRMLESPLLRYVGRRSYGIYLWHPAVIVALLQWRSELTVFNATLAVVLIFVVAEVSWRLVELPFLRMKRRPPAEAERSGEPARRVEDGPRVEIGPLGRRQLVVVEHEQ